MDFRWRERKSGVTCFEIFTGSSSPFFCMGSEISSRSGSAGSLSVGGGGRSVNTLGGRSEFL